MQDPIRYMQSVAAGLLPSGSSPKEQISAEENVQIRRSALPSTCLLHYDKAPLRLSSAKYQYMYDDTGRRYLDVAGSTSHVGHCHPALVAASQSHIGSLFTAFSDLSLSSELAGYPAQLLSMCPRQFDTALFTSTGSEAIDLSLQLARRLTGNVDVVVVENCFHGCLSTIIEMSPRELKRRQQVPKDWVHIIPLPDMFRGPHAGKSNASELYFQDAKSVIEKALARGRKMACFISEPVFITAGILVPPPGWLRKIHDYIHSIGAVVITDEMCTALGRNGQTFWGFERDQGRPDIICCGKPIGNGYPMAACLTRREILQEIGETDLARKYRPSPLGSAIGSKVLEIQAREDLTANARNVGALLLRELRLLRQRHGCIGDVRGAGLHIGVEFVVDQADLKPNRDVAECVVYRLKEDECIIAAAEGEFRNVLYITPPMCLSSEDARCVVAALDRVLSKLATHGTDVGFSSLGASLLEPLNPFGDIGLSAYEDVD